jgi:co-chaperonin GroES (HSP10)
MSRQKQQQDKLPLKSYIERVKKEQEAKQKENWANIKDQYMLQPIFGGDGRVLVKVDEFKSKFDCTLCLGKGHLGKPCGRCHGTKMYNDGIANVPCPTCSTGHAEGLVTLGFQLCEQCKGLGGTIIIPDVSKKMTDSGDVLAISKEGIKILKPGMKVLTATYTGVPFEFLDIKFKIIVEKDILGIMLQMKDVVYGVNQGTYADMENLGVARED